MFLNRSFSSSPSTLKKATKASSATASDTADPFDFAVLQRGIEQAHAKLREDLSKLRGGGKLNPEVVEALRVKLDKGTVTERLSNIAQVIPRGRTLQIIASEKDVGHWATPLVSDVQLTHGLQHLKAISSAILSSNLNLTPQPDAENELQLNINLPPPTTDARKEAVQAAQRAADVANDAVRNARGAHQKALRAMEKAKSARPDDVKKAGDQMEKIVTGGVAEVKKIADSAKKVLEGG